MKDKKQKINNKEERETEITKPKITKMEIAKKIIASILVLSLGGITIIAGIYEIIKQIIHK